MSDYTFDTSNLIDRSVKLLFREHPDALLRMVGMTGTAENLLFEDTNLNFPELRADHVMRIRPPDGKPPLALCVEYQLQPKPSLWPNWCLKWARLNQLLEEDVFLLVVYLEKGDRATFPTEHGVDRDNLTTKLRFTTLCLWEYRDRIESGELIELAPLLVLCEERPTEETLHREVELIHNSGLPSDVQGELLGVAALLATRNFAREVVKAIFWEEAEMIDHIENLGGYLQDLGVLDRMVEKTGIAARLRAEGEADGEARGVEEATRAMVLRLLTSRFGELPESLVQKIESQDAVWCQSLFDRAINANSLLEVISD